MSNKWNTIIGQIKLEHYVPSNLEYKKCLDIKESIEISDYLIKEVFAREKKDNRIKQKLKIKHQSFIHIFLIVVKLILLEANNGANLEVIASQIITLKIKGIGNNNILGHPDNFKAEN